MLKTVSRRAVRALLLVRRWQRIDCDLWVFRFRYLTLTGRVLRSWRDNPHGLIADSSDEAVHRMAAPVHCSSSDDDSTHTMHRMFVAMHVISSSQVAPVRLRRHRLDRRSRRDWV